MKSISLHEPWASLIRTGAKTWETRSWKTNYRGPLLICAAKKPLTDTISQFLCSRAVQAGLGPLVGFPIEYERVHWRGVTRAHLHFGEAVAVADLMICKPTGQMTVDEIGTDAPFGDFSPGRYGWRLARIRPVIPFPVKGHQRIFNVEDSLIKYEGDQCHNSAKDSQR